MTTCTLQQQAAVSFNICTLTQQRCGTEGTYRKRKVVWKVKMWMNRYGCRRNGEKMGNDFEVCLRVPTSTRLVEKHFKIVEIRV